MSVEAVVIGKGTKDEKAYKLNQMGLTNSEIAVALELDPTTIQDRLDSFTMDDGKKILALDKKPIVETKKAEGKLVEPAEHKVKKRTSSKKSVKDYVGEFKAAGLKPKEAFEKITALGLKTKLQSVQWYYNDKNRMK